MLIDGRECGRLRVSRQGSRLRFDAFCPGESRLIRLSVYGGGTEGYLGVMQPEKGGMGLHRMLGPSALAGFPDKITHAARQGTCPAPPEPPEETDTLWQRDALGMLWAVEQGVQLCAIPRSMGIARRGLELKPRVIQGTEYRIFEIGKIFRS